MLLFIPLALVNPCPAAGLFSTCFTASSSSNFWPYVFIWAVARAATASTPPAGIWGETLLIVPAPSPLRSADWIARALADCALGFGIGGGF